MHPLNELLCQDTKWKWSDACKRAFKLAKEKVVSPNVLVYYDPTLSISPAGDTSAYGVGAVISHIMRDGSECPIAFASRTLLASERNYAQEALSQIFASVHLSDGPQTPYHNIGATEGSSCHGSSSSTAVGCVFQRIHTIFSFDQLQNIRMLMVSHVYPSMQKDRYRIHPFSIHVNWKVYLSQQFR